MDRSERREQVHYTVDEVAAQLSVNPALIYRAIRRGDLIARRIGGRVLRISESDLQAYLQHCQLAACR